MVGITAGTLGGLIWRIPPHGLGTAILLVVRARAVRLRLERNRVFTLQFHTRRIRDQFDLDEVFPLAPWRRLLPLDFTPAAFQAITKFIPTGMINLSLTHCLTGRPLGVSLPLIFATCIAFFVAGTL